MGKLDDALVRAYTTSEIRISQELLRLVFAFSKIAEENIQLTRPVHSINRIVWYSFMKQRNVFRINNLCKEWEALRAYSSEEKYEEFFEYVDMVLVSPTRNGEFVHIDQLDTLGITFPELDEIVSVIPPGSSDILEEA